MKKLSIIVPVYNVEEYLDRCVNSLLHQSYKNIEIILVDDDSPDSCPRKCDDYAELDERIKVIHKQNEGLGYARNSGLEVATGEYVTFVDSDDFIDLGCYETCMKRCEKDNLDICYFQYKKINSRGETFSLSTIHEEYDYYSDNNLKELFLIMLGKVRCSTISIKQIDLFASVCMAVYKREVIERNHLKFSSERDMASEDLLFHLELYPFIQKVAVLPYEFYYWYYNEKSISTSYDNNKFSRFIKLLEYLKQRLPQIYSDARYLPHYKCYCLYIIKTVLRMEVWRDDTIKNRCARINRICNLDICRELYNSPHLVFGSLKDLIIVYAMKYKFSLFFVFLYKKMYRGFM